MRQRTGIREGIIAACAAILIACAVPAVASAQVQVVNANDDHAVDGCTPTDCTLREAVEQTTATEIQLPGEAPYPLEIGFLNIDRPLTIRGTGDGLASVWGNGTQRVFAIAADGDVTLSRLQILGGNAGAEVGGGIVVDGDSKLVLVDSEVINNEAENGAGIWANGELEVIRSAIARNIAGSDGGGIGLSNDAAPATFTNSTISTNDALRGGGIYTERSMTLQNVSIVDNTAAPANPNQNGGGLFQSFSGSDVTVATNTIVASNENGGCGGTLNFPIASDHGMLHELNPQPSCNVTNPAANFIVTNPLLGELDDNFAPRLHPLIAGSPAINKGTTPCPSPDQRGKPRPMGGTCDIGAYEFEQTGPSGPPGGNQPPPPPPDDDLPPPQPGKSVNALPKSGTVKIKLPGSSAFVTLAKGQQIPVGTTIDVTKGRITLVAAADKNGGTATADFYGGIFKLGQTKGAKPITTLKLVEKLACKASGKASAAKKKKKKRRLWGDGKGRFRTEGSYSSATVRGTKWLTQDTCTSTLTKVVRGKVAVRDFVKRKTVIVKAGKQYVAKRKP